MQSLVLMCDAVRMRVGHVEVNNEARQAKLTGRPALSVFLAIANKQTRRICDRDDPVCTGMCACSQSTDIPVRWPPPLPGLSSPDYKLQQQTVVCCGLGDVRLSDALFSGSRGGLDNSQRPSRAGVVDCQTAVPMQTQQSISAEK